MTTQEYCSKLIAPRAGRGFALVVTLSLMVLLTIVAVGLLGLSAVSLRGTRQGVAQAEAKANARMAMMLAIGELQKQLGPDQRISMTADQRMSTAGDGGKTSAAVGNRYWTGVFNSWDAGSNTRPNPAFRTWLVSGDPSQVVVPGMADTELAGTGAIDLVGEGTLGSLGDNRVKVPSLSLASGSNKTGRLAWWVGDQGVKAALVTPSLSTDTALGAIRQGLQSAPRNATELAAAGAIKPFAGLAANDPRTQLVTSWQQSAFLASSIAGARPLFHDLAPWSTGLLTNVRSGGFRKDLSMKLEQILSDTEITALATKSLYTVSGEPGINFQELWAYYHLQEQLQRGGGGTYTTGGSIGANTPYLKLAAGGIAASTDNFHHFKQPIVVSYQLVLSFSMRPDTSFNTGKNLLNLDFDPVFTLWNPLDVPVVVPPESCFVTGFWQIPYDLNVSISGSTGTRSYPKCALALSACSKGSNKRDQHWCDLSAGKIQQLVLKPGEVIMISQAGNTKSMGASGAYIPIGGKAGFNYGGGVTNPLLDSTENYIVVDSSDTITYTATPNNLTAGKDSYSGGNVPPGPQLNSRRWALTSDFFILCDSSGAFESNAVGAGQVSLDYCMGNKRPAEGERTGSTGSNRRDGAASRIFANNFQQVFIPITGAQNTRQIPAGSINGAKAPFMSFAFNAKTEVDSTLGTRSFAQFNPRAFHVDFYNFADKERDMLPYEVVVTPMTSWLKAPLDNNPSGNGYYGGSHFAQLGSTFVTTHTVPREPIVSLAAFQHSCANGFNFLRPSLGGTANDREPMLPHVSHAIGNSLAPPMLASDQTEGTLPKQNALPASPYPLADHSYLANRALWDDYFLSGIAPQNTPAFSKARDQKTVAAEFFAGATPLPVRRYLPALDGKDASQLLGSYFGGSGPSDTAISNLASYLRVDGLFNVNSTSVEAWKTVLGSLKSRPIVVRDDSGAETIAVADGNTPVANLAAPKNVIAKDEAVPNNDQWVGRRTLTDSEIDSLAQAIVKEVRKRGPFISLADFINRRVGTDKDLAKSGAVQSALDSPNVLVNKIQNTSRSVSSTTANRFAFPEAESGPINYGSPSLVKQGDILTPIAPVLSARSDSFIIRTYGESVDSGGNVKARAWCEAVVERDRNFVDPADAAETVPARPSNVTFGRRFCIKSFRWLNSSEI